MITNSIVNPVPSRKSMLLRYQEQIASIEDDGIREGYEPMLPKAIAILDGMEKAVDAIRTNTSLSEKGMELKIVEPSRRPRSRSLPGSSPRRTMRRPPTLDCARSCSHCRIRRKGSRSSSSPSVKDIFGPGSKACPRRSA